MGTHDNSLHRTAELVPRMAPLIMHPALFCNCSICRACSSVILLIRISPYSITGRINALYIISNVFLSKRYLRNASISTRFPALIIISSMWFPQERLCVKTTPKCLWDFTSVTAQFPKIIGGGGLILFFNETSIASVLEGQNDTSHLSAHLVILFRSVLILSAASLSLEKSTNRVVSAAKRRMLVPMFSVISFIKIRNNKGPITDPCGTPAWTWPISDVALPRTTRCFWSDK